MRPSRSHLARGFTLIEIMVVVAILGLVMSIGIPAIYRMVRKESLATTVSDVVSICLEARSRAIMKGNVVELHIRPGDGRLTISTPAPVVDRTPQTQFDQVATRNSNPPPRKKRADMSAATPSGSGETPDPAAMIGAHQMGTGATAQIPQSVRIEMLDGNCVERKDTEEAVVRFYGNGTSDEFTLVLHGDNGEWRKISLELVTGLPDVGPFP